MAREEEVMENNMIWLVADWYHTYEGGHIAFRTWDSAHAYLYAYWEERYDKSPTWHNLCVDEWNGNKEQMINDFIIMNDDEQMWYEIIPLKD